MRLRATRLTGAAAVLLLAACAWPAAKSGQDADLIHNNPEAWQSIPAPGGSKVTIVVDRAGPRAAIVLRYRPEKGRLAAISRDVRGLSGGGLSVTLETDAPASVVIGAVEKDGSMFQALVSTQARQSREVGLTYDQLLLSKDSADENGRLDLNQVTRIVIADPAGFISQDLSERSMRISSVAMVDRADQRLQPRNYHFTFDTGQDNWSPLAAPTGSDVKISVERDGAASALVARYRPVANKLAGVIRAVDGLAGRGLRVRLKTDASASIVIGVVVANGSMYQTVVQTRAGEWQDVRVPFEALKPPDSAKDKQSTLRPGDARTLVVADPAGFLKSTDTTRTLWIDEVAVESDAAAAGAGVTYQPLVTLGPPNSTGSRASTGVTYRPGKFGQAALLDSQGETLVVPVAGLGRRAGTIEAWISPQFRPNDARDFSALFAMQNEPFTQGVASSLIVFYGAAGRISVLANGEFNNVLSTPALNWTPGEWHHLAVSWGDRGLRLYWDGRLAASRAGARDLGVHTALVVGNHAWTTVTHLVSRTTFDELRVSAIQRTDDEMRESAARQRAPDADSTTVALEHFDSAPWPPIRLAGDPTAFYQTDDGTALNLRVAIPFAVNAGTVLRYDVSTPGGTSLHAGQHVLTREGSAEFSLRVPGSFPDGFYRIRFKLPVGSTESDVGSEWFRVRSRAAGAAPSMLFGAAGHLVPEDADRFFRLAAAAGVRSYRTAFEWSEIEPQDGVFVWDRHDRIVAAAGKHGVELIPTLFWELPQPSWAGPGVSQSGWTTSKYPPGDLDKWGDFVFRVVERYKSSITWWIPSNEPNLAQFWYPRPNPRAYVAFLKATRDAARRADPRAKLLGGSVAGMDLPFLDQIFTAGALDLVDAVGIHAYIAPHAPEDQFPLNNFDLSSQRGTFAGGLSSVRQLIVKHGGTQRIWIDEVGQPYREDFVIPGWGVPEPEAASNLVKLHVEALASGQVDRVMWFSLWGGEYGSFALVRPDLTPTLPLVAYASLADWLSGAVFVRSGTRGDAVRSFTFRGPRGTFDVVWSSRGKTTIDLKEADKVFDVYGRPSEPPSSARFTVDRTPWVILSAAAR